MLDIISSWLYISYQINVQSSSLGKECKIERMKKQEMDLKFG